MPWQPPILRETNNHTAEKADGWRKLARDVIFAYGHKYQRAADYLTQLANNDLWRDADFPQLTWHERALLAPPVAQPRYIMHDSIINALAPSVPLRTVWQGNRREWSSTKNGKVLWVEMASTPYPYFPNNGWTVFFGKNIGPVAVVCFDVLDSFWYVWCTQSCGILEMYQTKSGKGFWCGLLFSGNNYPNCLEYDFRGTHKIWGWFSMHPNVLGNDFRCTQTFWGGFSMHPNMFGGDFRCTQTFLAGIFDALKLFRRGFSMHSNFFREDFRCTQTCLAGIFDAPKHFW